MFGDESVDDAADDGELVGGEFGDVVDVFAEGVFGGVEWPSRAGVDEEIVGADVEDFGEADDGFGGGAHAAVFVAADLAGVGADLGGEIGLGPAVFGPELLEPLAQGQGAVVAHRRPLCDDYRLCA